MIRTSKIVSAEIRWNERAIAVVIEGLVSVIIPAYNVADCFERAIDSVLAQNYSNIEILLVDDGSTDGKTAELCDRYAAQYPNITAFHKKNGGPSSARNYGMEYASGEYLYFPDADDWIEEDLISDAVHSLKKYRADYVIFGYFMELEKADGEYVRFRHCVSNELFFPDRETLLDGLIDLCDQSLMYGPCNKLYKKSIIERAQLYYCDIPFGEDFLFNLDYLQNVQKAVVLPDCYYHYVRNRKGSISNAFNSNWFAVRKQEYYQIADSFKRLGIPEEKSQEYLARRLSERILGCLENEFSIDNRIPIHQKKQHIAEMLSDPLTQDVFQKMVPTSTKVKVMSIPIKMKSTVLTCLMGKIVAWIHYRMPALFFRLKERR